MYRDSYDCSGSIAVDPGCTSERVAGVMCAVGSDIPTMNMTRESSACTTASIFMTLAALLLYSIIL